MEATLNALSDGQYHTVVKCTSPAGDCCLEAFACVVTPKASISRPSIDLGNTFLGVMVKQVGGLACVQVGLNKVLMGCARQSCAGPALT